MKIAAILGTDGGVSFAAEGFHKALSRVGENTGNTLFQRAVWDLIRGPKFNAGLGIMSPRDVAQNANVLVIPAANQINPHFNLNAWADYVEECDLPCVVIGLGAQSDDPNVAPEDLVLPDGVKRFARAISARSHLIGVRGDYTRRVLAKMNIDNTIITGCPSQTINTKISGVQIQERIDNACKSPYFNLAILGGTLQEYTRDTERKLYNLAKDFNNHKVVFQTQPNILRFVHDRGFEEDSRNFFNFMRAVVRPDLNDDKFFHYLGTKGCVYSDARSWIDAMASVDLAIGMRIHGAVAAIQAGRLGVCVAFDSRTLELAKTMEIPYVLPDDVMQCDSFESLMGAIKFDPVSFESKRKNNLFAIAQVMGDYFK